MFSLATIIAGETGKAFDSICQMDDGRQKLDSICNSTPEDTQKASIFISHCQILFSALAIGKPDVGRVILNFVCINDLTMKQKLRKLVMPRKKSVGK